MRLGLGTVQFGLDYGVSNPNGKTPLREVERILALAASYGIEILDTAPLYGSSEEVLGQILLSSHPFSIVTKTPQFEKPYITDKDAHCLNRTFLSSLEKLKQNHIYGLLIHHADDLLAQNGHLLMEKLHELKSLGLVQKVGVSVYTTSQVKRILARFSVDIVQLPFNVLDQRMSSEGCLTLLKEAGVEIHARSVFLQGLLLIQPDRLPAYFAKVKPHLERYHGYLQGHRLSPVQAALGFVMGVKELDIVLCGVTDCRELEAILSEVSLPPNMDGLKAFVIEDPAVLNPSNWLL